MRPKGNDGLMNESERDGTEDCPLKGFEVLLKEFVEREEYENSEGKASVSHGYVEGEASLRVDGGVDFLGGVWRRRNGGGFSEGGGSEHVVPWWSGGGRVCVRVRDKFHDW